MIKSPAAGAGAAIGFKSFYILSQQARCGSSMEVNGDDFEIANSRFMDNGTHNGNYVSDGITVNRCKKTSSGPEESVHDNLIKNNTDVGLVSGGGAAAGRGCVMRDNQITQNNATAYVGLHIGNFIGGGGDHTKMTYGPNTVTGNGFLSAGVMAGFHAFGDCTKPVFGGTISGNTVVGAFVDLLVDGYTNGTITGNTLSVPSGVHDLFANCQHPLLPTKLTAGDYSNVNLQTGAVAMVFHANRCCAPTGACHNDSCP